MPRPIPHFGWPTAGFELNEESPQAYGLVAWWSPLKSRGTHTLWDISGFGHNAVFPGGANNPTWVATAETGAVLDYDGINDSVVLYSYPAGTTVTISVWVKGSGGWYVLGGHPLADDVWFIGYLGGAFNFATFRYSDGGLERACNGATTVISDGAWHHLAGVTDVNSGKLYVDGRLEATNVNGGNWGGGTIRMGRDPTSALWFTGSIGDARIYNRPFNDDEVWRLFRNPWGLHRTPMVPRVLVPAAPAVGNPWYNYAQM